MVAPGMRDRFRVCADRFRPVMPPLARPRCRGRGAPQGAFLGSRRFRRARPERRPHASRRSTSAIFRFGAVLPGLDRRSRAPSDPAGFRPRSTRPSSSRSTCGPSSLGADGQPEASRRQGYEPHPQAPPSSRVSWRPRKRPRWDEVNRNIIQCNRNVKLANE